MSVIDVDSIEGSTRFSAWLASLFDVPRVRNVGRSYFEAPAPVLPKSGTVGSCAKQGRGAAGSSQRRPSPQAALREVERLLEVERERSRKMERVASHYVSPHVLERLMEDPDGLSLGGEAHEVTVLFADMRGFTTLSAVLRRQPGRLAEVINGILSPLTEIVVAHGGTIDKYMGDCVMAFWGAPVDDPRHAANALAAARAMLAAMPAINRELAEAHPDLDLPTIQIGVGVNTGECVVGNVGSRRRFDYSVLGDPVNVASRLQTLCKTYEHPLLIGEETARHVAADVAVVEIDQVAFGGSDEAQGVYAVL